MKFGVSTILLMFSLVSCNVAVAHKGHSTAHVALDRDASPTTESPFPIPLDGSFELTDQFGTQRSNREFEGRLLLVYFGYVHCDAMCPLVFDRIGGAMDLLGDSAEEIVPIVITVDPKRDTMERLRLELPKYHSGLIGLTGSESELNAVYDAYDVSPVALDIESDSGPVTQHNSFIYLVSSDGTVKTMIPPMLGARQIAGIVQTYLTGSL